MKISSNTVVTKRLLALAALALLGGCDTEQGPTTCRAAGGGQAFAVKNILVNRGTCTDAQLEAGEIASLATYDAPGSPVTSIAIGVEGIPAFSAAGAPQLAQGDLSSKNPDAQNTCSAPTLTPLAAPDGSITYAFSNVDLYVSAANQGTQMRGDLAITQGSCTATYRVLGLWPAVECESDADCQAEGTGINPDLRDEVACEPTLGACVLKGSDFVKVGGDA